MQTEALSDEQKEYLQGFAAGVKLRERLGSGPAAVETPVEQVFGVPLDELSREERIKAEGNPLDIWDSLLRHAAENRLPSGSDIFRFKFFGLFNVAPAQDKLMLRVRIPGCRMTAYQLHGLARIAREMGGGYAHVTTRGNVQIREIAPKHIIDLLSVLSDVGLSSKGAGADNIRNVTASPTAGIDPTELFDVGPLARDMQLYITHHRDLYGLPRKFNIAFDGGGAVGVVTDTNDIGFSARIDDGVDQVGFRVAVAGITGHKRFALDCGYNLAPEECVPLAAAMLRVFIQHGDRTDRKRARLCYVIDKLGLEGFLSETEKLLGYAPRRTPLERCRPRPQLDRQAHLGLHRQKQVGLSYLGVVVPVGRLTATQMDGLAEIAARYGDGTLRSTVWQNLLIPNLPDAAIEVAGQAVGALGLGVSASVIGAGLVACTGNSGCKFAASDTKGHALALRDHLEARVTLDRPINIHLTGCPHSCAQHYIGDIGLLGVGPESYNVLLGGGSDGEPALARDFASDVAFTELPALLARLLASYQDNRHDAEGFTDFVRRLDIADLRRLVGLTA
jgi:ferredoxin-nitrite reductase